MELVPYNPYFIGERALPNRLKGALDRVSFTLGAADRIALFPERYRHPHRRRSPRGGRWWMITIPDLAEIRGL
jgi:hypothetical protein